MGVVEDRIRELGHTLPGEWAPGGNYVPTVPVPYAGLVYTAGHTARRLDGTVIAGKLGDDLTIEEEKREGDTEIEKGGIRLLVDIKSQLYLAGTTLDHTKGLDGRGFVFVNPNATGTCGCGESFSV